MMIFAGDLAVWLGFAFCSVFCIMYMTVAPWYRSEIGVHFMTVTAFNAVLFAYLAYTTTIRVAEPQAPLLRFLIFGSFSAFMLWRLSLLIRIQILDALRQHRMLTEIAEKEKL